MSRLGKTSMLPGPRGGLPAWAMPPRVTAAPVTGRAARPPAISRCLGDRDVRDAGQPKAPCPPPRPPCWVGRVLVIAYSAVAPCPHTVGRSRGSHSRRAATRPAAERRGSGSPQSGGGGDRKSVV